MPAHALARSEEAGAEHVVRAPASDRVEHGGELRGVVLAVAVEVDRGRIPVLAGVREPGPQRRPEPARLGVGDQLGAGGARDGGGTVARAVVDDHDIDGHPARPLRESLEHAPEARLLVAGDDDRQAAAARGGRRSDGRISERDKRAPAGRGRNAHAEQLGDGRRQLADRPRLAAHRARHGALAPDHERHRALAPVEVPVPADPAALPVVCHQDHRRALERAAL